MSHESAILDPVSNTPQLTAWLQRARAQSTDTKRGRMYRLHGAPPPEALTALCLYAPRAAQNRMLNQCRTRKRTRRLRSRQTESRKRNEKPNCSFMPLFSVSAPSAPGSYGSTMPTRYSSWPLSINLEPARWGRCRWPAVPRSPSPVGVASTRRARRPHTQRETPQLRAAHTTCHRLPALAISNKSTSHRATLRTDSMRPPLSVARVHHDFQASGQQVDRVGMHHGFHPCPATQEGQGKHIRPSRTPAGDAD